MSARLQIISLVSLLLNCCMTSFCADPRQSHHEWQVYGGDLAGSKYSALDQINRPNSNKLKPAWIYRCDDMRDNPASTIECNPIIVDGVMFITTSGLKVVALDAATGTQRWVFDPWNGKGGRGVNRGVTYWASEDDKRIFYVAGNFLYALNAANGRPIASFGIEGKVDLRDGLDREVFFLSVRGACAGV